MAGSFTTPLDNPNAAPRALSKMFNPVSPTVFGGGTTTPTAAQSITPPIGGGFAGGKGGLNNATASGQIQSGQLHADVSNFHDWYGSLTPEQAKTFAPNTTDAKGANYVNPVAGGNVAPGPRTADNLEGIQKENARQHFMRTLQLGQNAPATPTTTYTPNLPIGPTPGGTPQGGALTASQSISPPISDAAFAAHKGFADQQGQLDEAQKAGTSVEGLAARKTQDALAQAQQGEAQKAKDQIYNKTQSGIDVNEARAGYYKAQGAAAGTNAATRATDVAQKPAIATAGNQSKETIATAGNQSKETIATAGNQSKETIATAGNQSKETIATAGNQSKETIATAGNQSKETIATAGNQSKETIATAKNASAEGIAKIHADTQKAIADAKAQAAQTGKAPDYTKIKTTIDKNETDWEKNYRTQFEKERVAKGDRAAEDAFRDKTIAEHRKLTESRYPEVYGAKSAATQPAGSPSASAVHISGPDTGAEPLWHQARTTPGEPGFFDVPLPNGSYRTISKANLAVGVAKAAAEGKVDYHGNPINVANGALPAAPEPGTPMQPGAHDAHAQAFLDAAGGDPAKARAMAEAHGWSFGEAA